MKRIPYTYLIGWTEKNIFYYGRRTAKKCHPHEFWDSYFTSSKYVKKFRVENGEPDLIQIHKTFKSIDECKKYEEDFLIAIDAQHNTAFLNQKNGDSKWDTTGKVCVKDKDNNNFMVNISDERYVTGELICATKGKKQKSKNKNTVTVKDDDGKFSRISCDDPRFLTGELVGVNKGKIPVKDIDGNMFLVESSDPRWLSGELNHVSKGISNEVCKNMVTVRGKDGKCFNISTSDSRWLSGELLHSTKGVPSKLKGRKRGSDNTITCPHCGKEGGERIMKRWHFDNCKHQQA